MFAPCRRLGIDDFVLLGLSVATLVLLLFPTRPPRQTILVQSIASSGKEIWQPYTMALDDVRLAVFKRQLDRCQHPNTSRALRAARWHQQVADYYAQQTRPDAESNRPIAQVSYLSDSRTSIQQNASQRIRSARSVRQYWKEYSEVAQVQAERAAERIDRIKRFSSAPVKLGAVVPPMHSSWAIPIALLGGLAVAMLAYFRQSQRPPIALDCHVDAKHLPGNTPRRIRIEIPSSWVKIHQPIEVKLWRVVYAGCVLVATGLVVGEIIGVIN